MTTIVKLPESTIQKIAAGEVITRPVNVVKELMENSLDAGSTNIRIIIELGGLNLIDIIDNGHGIARFNSELLCERHATSKLRSADDLSKISTFGFRGEALASVSEMANVEVRSFNMSVDKMGWQCRYQAGRPMGQIFDKYLQNPGTQITVTNLFTHLTQRKNIVKTNHSEEKKAIVELVKRYALHHRDTVTISLKETATSSDLILVLAPLSVKPCVGQFFGIEMENNLWETSFESQERVKYRFQMVFSYKKHSGAFQKCATSNQSSTFIFFVNNRLVECQRLRRELEAIADGHLNSKQYNHLIYVALNVPSCDIDVNMHPSKATIALHYHDEITSRMIDSMKEKLKESLGTQSIDTNRPSSIANDRRPVIDLPKALSQVTKEQPATPSVDHHRLGLLAPSCQPSPNTPRSNTAATPAKRPHDLIHNDSFQQTLRQLSCANKTKPSSRGKHLPNELIQPWPGIDNINHATSPTIPQTRSKTKADEPKRIEVINLSSDESQQDPIIEERPKIPKTTTETVNTPTMETKPDPEEIPFEPKININRREMKLTSLVNLKNLVAKEAAGDYARSLIKGSVFVGIFDHDRALIQHTTKLYAINLKAYLRELYYQFYLFDFGNFPPIEILPPGNKIELFIQTYLDDIKKHEPHNFKNLKFNTFPDVIEKLLKHSNMFQDYLSLKLTREEIITIPCIMPDEVPNLIYLGKFLVRLANEVDYIREQSCFRDMGRVIADYYAEAPANLKDQSVHRKYHELLETKLYVAIKHYLIVPEWLLQNENICQISDTKDLYKVFERC